MRTANFAECWLLSEAIACGWGLGEEDESSKDEGECSQALRDAAKTWWQELLAADTLGVSFGMDDRPLFFALHKHLAAGVSAWSDGHTEIAFVPATPDGGLFILTTSPDAIEFVPQSVVDSLDELTDVQAFTVSSTEGGGWSFWFEDVEDDEDE
jgi:hypothetical protein